MGYLIDRDQLEDDAFSLLLFVRSAYDPIMQYLCSGDANSGRAQPRPAPPTLTTEIPEPTVSPALEPPPGFTQYQDSEVGIAVFVPESWAVVEVDPGQSVILKSYPEGKYVGGEAFEPDDPKCDLAIRPPEFDVASHMQQLKSDPTVTIVSEQEIVLQSGKPGTRMAMLSLSSLMIWASTPHI